jgi:hypothetical protein
MVLGIVLCSLKFPLPVRKLSDEAIQLLEVWSFVEPTHALRDVPQALSLSLKYFSGTGGSLIGVCETFTQ